MKTRYYVIEYTVNGEILSDAIPAASARCAEERLTRTILENHADPMFKIFRTSAPRVR